MHIACFVFYRLFHSNALHATLHKKRFYALLVVDLECPVGGDSVAEKSPHGPADVLQTVFAFRFRPRAFDHLLHDEKHKDFHVRSARVVHITGDVVLNECFVCR